MLDPLDPARLTPAASLNRVRIVDLPGLALDPDVRGQTGYELLSAQARAAAIRARQCRSVPGRGLHHRVIVSRLPHLRMMSQKRPSPDHFSENRPIQPRYNVRDCSPGWRMTCIAEGLTRHAPYLHPYRGRHVLA